MNPPENWYCCLAPPEQAVFNFLATALPLDFWTGVPQALVDALWSIFGVEDEWRREGFYVVYHLAHGSVTVDDAPVEVILPEAGWVSLWVLNGLFFLTPGGACLDGCGQSVRPTP